MGLTKFYNGVPCSRGHDSNRRVGGGCCKCKNEDNKRYYVPKGRPRLAPVMTKQMPLVNRTAFDVVLFKPGSPKVQSAMGCDAKVAFAFPKSSWAKEKTAHMRVYPLDRETFTRIASKCRKEYVNKHASI